MVLLPEGSPQEAEAYSGLLADIIRTMETHFWSGVVIRVLLRGARERLGKAKAASPTRLEELQHLSHDTTRHKEGERAKNGRGVG